MALYDTFERAYNSSDYFTRLKPKVQEQLLEHMSRALGIPNITEHVEVIEVATPLTFYRYTENFGGSFMGWRLTPDQGAFSIMEPKTPVKNLFVCGQWLGVGGIASVMANGREASKLADRYLQAAYR
jgi:phytoene dehydrogenase-like protein